jgi:hypothetical protein
MAPAITRRSNNEQDPLHFRTHLRSGSDGCRAGFFRPGPGTAGQYDFLRHECRFRQGCRLGGLDGADKICQALAQAAGAGGKTWRAYLSTQGATGVNARDRIGKGPWTNAKGVVVAKDVADLHGPSNNLNKQTALNEKGDVVNGRGDTPNMHDILTGSQPTERNFPTRPT